MGIIEHFRRNVDDFKADILKLEKFQTGTRTSYYFFKRQYPGLLKEFNDKKRSAEEAIGMGIFKNLDESIAAYEHEIFKYCFINLIARIEAFFNDVACSVYLRGKPDLKEEERDKIILNFSHLPFRKKLNHFRKEFELNFTHIESRADDIAELFSTRNIILHNNAVVNETYLKHAKDSKLNIGDKRAVSEAYLKYAFVIAVIIAKSVEEQVRSEVS